MGPFQPGPERNPSQTVDGRGRQGSLFGKVIFILAGIVVVMIIQWLSRV